MASLKCTIMTIASLIPVFVLAQTSGTEWLTRIDQAERMSHSKSVVEQTITTSSGSERILTMKGWSAKNGDLSLMVYIAPARIKGDKILLRDGGDNIWYYMQRRDVTRHFAGHNRKQNAMGSDFTYEDLSTGTMTEDYIAEVLGEEIINGDECINLLLKPTDSGPSYDHLMLWADVNDALTRKIDYYDDEGLLKTLQLSNIQEVDGRKVPMNMLMTNVRENSTTRMYYKEISFKEEPDLSIFNTNSLSRELE
ncbi:outer membrane lipoprotein-sorting protein [Calditrichota bacterium]